MNKRLFLFAGFNAQHIIDDALVYYVRALSKCGDVVLCMDSDCSDAELQKLAPYVLHATAQRHGEYDFGSYKRAYMYATDTGILDKYDFVYMVNDSVYGPLMDIKPSLIKMERTNCDAFGLAYNKMASRTHGVKFACLYNCPGRSVYNNVAALFRRGMPFMKKVAFNRCNGALGNRILYILNHVSPATRSMILTSAQQQYGDEYIRWLLTRNPIKIAYRHIKHALRKIFIEGL